MKILILIFVTLCILCNSCIIPKNARILKRTTKTWSKSPLIIEAYIDSPFSGVSLTLRNNGKFNHRSFGLFQSFSAGTWTFSQDTIRLTYLDSKLKPVKNKNVIIDRLTSTLIFEGESTPIQMRMKIKVNML